jgi:hypothetical protein
VQSVIKRKILEEKSEESLEDLLFEEKVPKGHGKNEPIVILPDVYQRFDLNEGFLSLSMDIFCFILHQLEVFEKAMIELETK